MTQNDFQQEMQETFTGVASKVGDVLIAYAQQHGYTLVLDGGNQEAQWCSMRIPLPTSPRRSSMPTT